MAIVMFEKFTDRFIKLPIKVYDVNVKELTGNCVYEDNYMKILPEEICQYKPTEDVEFDNIECVSIRLKNGDTFYTYLTIVEFEKLLNKHHALQHSNKQV